MGDLNLENISKLNEKDFVEKLNPVYKLINLVKIIILQKQKHHWVVGAPWTLLVYKSIKSPKLGLKKFFENKSLIDKTLTDN